MIVTPRRNPDERVNLIRLQPMTSASNKSDTVRMNTTATQSGETQPRTVAVIENFSAHADYAEILDWLKGFEQAPRQTFITHGEPAAADALRHRVEESLGWSCRVPDYLESASLE